MNGSIIVNGGNGRNGGNGSRSLLCGQNGGDGGGGGAGGAGGFVVLQATSVSVSGSLQATDGNGGTGGVRGTDPLCTAANGAINGFVGGGGGGGRITVISPNAVQRFTTNNGSPASGSTGGTPTKAIQQVAACTPTVTSIQVDGQTTNTVVAGERGGRSVDPA